MEEHQALAAIEHYYDAVPRSSARVEDHPPFRLFVKDGHGWPFYARPHPAAKAFAPADVVIMRVRQRELGVPEAFEWIGELAPSLRPAAEAAGLTVVDHPLMVYDEAAARSAPAPADVTIELVRPDGDLRLIGAVAPIGFAAAGTAVGDAGIEDLLRAAAARDPRAIEAERARIAAGRTVTAVALVDSVPVGVGNHQPVGTVTEIVGVATLPAFRRRGIGAAVTDALVRDARRRGMTTIFLSAGDADVARIYAAVGFRRIATACIAEPAPATPAEDVR